METAEKNLQENLNSLRLLKKKVHKCSKAIDVFIGAQAKMAKIVAGLSHAYTGTEMYKIFQDCERFSVFMSGDTAAAFLETNKNIERAMDLILTDTACKLATVKRDLANSSTAPVNSSATANSTATTNNSTTTNTNTSKIQNFSTNLYGTITRKYTNNIDPRMKRNLKVVSNFEPNSSKINLNEIQPSDASLLSAFDVNKMVVQTKFDLPSMVLTYLKNMLGFFSELEKNFGRDPEEFRKFQLQLQTMLTTEKDQLNEDSRRLIEQLNLPLSSDTNMNNVNFADTAVAINFADSHVNPAVCNVGAKDAANLLSSTGSEKSDQMEGYLLWLKSKKNLISQRVYCIFNYANVQLSIYSEDPQSKVSKNNVGLFNKIFSTNSKLLESFKVRRIERLENVTPQHVKSIKLTTDNQKKTYIFDGGKLTNIDIWFDAINSRVAQFSRLSVMNATSGTNISVGSSNKRKLTAAPPMTNNNNGKSDEIMTPEMIFNFVSSCCDIIEKNFFEETGIYRISPTKNELDTLFDAFVNGQFLTDGTSSAYAGMVKKLVRDSTFLINSDCYELWKEASTKNDVPTFIEGAEKLPEISNRILHRLFQHLKEIAKFSGKNMMDYSNLAIVFAPTIFFNVDSEALMNLSVQKAIVVELMVHVNKVFNPVLGIPFADDDEKACTIQRSGPGFSTKYKGRTLNASKSLSDDLTLGLANSVDDDDDAFEDFNESGLERTMPVNSHLVKQKTLNSSTNAMHKAVSDKSLHNIGNQENNKVTNNNNNRRGGVSRHKRFERSKATKSVDNQQDAIEATTTSSMDDLDVQKTDENDHHQSTTDINKLPLSERLKFFEKKISNSDDKKPGGASVGRQQTVNVHLSSNKFNKFKSPPANDKPGSKGTWL